MIEIGEAMAIAAFQSYTGAGSEFRPTALLEAIDASEANPSYVVDLNLLRTEIRTEIGYSLSLYSNETPDDIFRDRWTAAIRWILRQVNEWGQVGGLKNEESLRALVAAAYILDTRANGLAGVARFLVTDRVQTGLRHLLAKFTFTPVLSDRRQFAAHEEVRKLAASGKYEWVLPRFHHLFFAPGTDFAAYVILLHAASPDILSQVVELKDDVNFCGLVCESLGKEALPFALQVSNVIFKFVCVAKYVHSHRQSDLSPGEAFLAPLLRQVSESSQQNWASWMRAFLQYPGGYPLIEEKLASMLGPLDELHWNAFLKAPSLGFTERQAAPFANLMIRFRDAAGDELFNKMCQMAYRIWDKWNYRDPDRQFFMFSPATCAFDFPVAAYYATQQDENLLAEENRLMLAIDTVEQQWFESSSALHDERYRLMSRLRLVQHGMALKLGSLEALPPEIAQASHSYYRSRFIFHARSH